MGDVLRIDVILGKAARQGASAQQRLDLAVKLALLTGQDLAQASGSAYINVGDLLRAGIRLHPFTMQNTSISLLKP